jgi:hypothetical protein
MKARMDKNGYHLFTSIPNFTYSLYSVKSTDLKIHHQKFGGVPLLFMDKSQRFQLYSSCC